MHVGQGKKRERERESLCLVKACECSVSCVNCVYAAVEGMVLYALYGGGVVIEGFGGQEGFVQL